MLYLIKTEGLTDDKEEILFRINRLDFTVIISIVIRIEVTYINAVEIRSKELNFNREAITN